MAGCLNTGWMLACMFEGAAFARATRRVGETQARVLCDILRANKDTRFGKAHDFAALSNPRAYQRRVSLASYEDLALRVDAIASGERNVLTHDRVLTLEPTSGTTGGEKLIPHTAGLRRQFQRGVAAWIADLFHGRPAVRRGRAYWSISPALSQPRKSLAGIPIGFEEDAAYLGAAEQFALKRLLAVPSILARVPDLTAFRYCTLLFLLAAGDLSLISVWSPTFLSTLIAALPAWQERLCYDLTRGQVNPPAILAPGLTSLLRGRLQADPRRARYLATIFRAGASPSDYMHGVWPQLVLISCWMDGAARRFIPELRRLFPAVELQAKGLLATEGFVSLPLLEQPAAALAVRCHFFEFEETLGQSRPCRLAHELERGGRYRVILTTAGGLYRYQLGDEVEVVGFLNACPLLRFLGRGDRVSDFVGEKLADTHVRAALEESFAACQLNPSFAMLVPVPARPPRYRLYLQGQDLGPRSEALENLRRVLEAALSKNPYYRQAVALGQLGKVEIAVFPPEGTSAWLLYERGCLARGIKWGDIKPVALAPGTEWAEVFESLVSTATEE